MEFDGKPQTKFKHHSVEFRFDGKQKKIITKTIKGYFCLVKFLLLMRKKRKTTKQNITIRTREEEVD